MAVWASVVLLILSLSLAAENSYAKEEYQFHNDSLIGVRQNVALNKPASMSSRSGQTQSAKNAVDGVTAADRNEYSAHTKEGETSAWWKVDLQVEVQSAQTNIYFRTDYKKRRNGVQLYTSVTNSSDPKEGSLCHTVTGSPNGTDIPDVLNVTCPGTWRYLTVYTETDNDGYGALFDFTEVQVWVCAYGYYGTNCGQRCAVRHCKMSSSCEVHGQCVGGCAAGYHGQDCTQDCQAGFYGNNCFLRCTDRHCQSSSCHGDGACVIQCDAGWTLHDCTQVCPNGTYGIKCYSACGHCADTNTCHHVTGACPGGCQAGWQLPLCQTELQMDSVITPATAGIIGLAAGICFMLILGVGLHVCLVRRERLQWINASQKDVVRVKDTHEPVDRNTAPPSDNYTSLSEQAGGPNIYNNDYDAVDVEAKANSDYDVIKNKAYNDL